MSQKNKGGAIAAQDSGVESFTVRLPADVSRRLRYYAREDEKSPEFYMAEATISFIVAQSQGLALHLKAEAMQARAAVLNTAAPASQGGVA